jgi:hypothetical protein
VGVPLAVSSSGHVVHALPPQLPAAVGAVGVPAAVVAARAAPKPAVGAAVAVAVTAIVVVVESGVAGTAGVSVVGKHRAAGAAVTAEGLDGLVAVAVAGGELGQQRSDAGMTAHNSSQTAWMRLSMPFMQNAGRHVVSEHSMHMRGTRLILQTTRHRAAIACCTTLIQYCM